MKNIQPILNALNNFQITDKFFRAAILANIEKECGLIPQEENLNYSKTSVERIRKIFGSRLRPYTDSQINTIKQNPEQFAEMVYGRKTRIGQGMGNVNEGDGWKYRGRGYIQITGKANYERIGKLINQDLVNNPDLLVSDLEISALASVMFILTGTKKRTFNTLEDACREVTQVIGGAGLNLSVGYGRELLIKVIQFAQKYI